MKERLIFVHQVSGLWLLTRQARMQIGSDYHFFYWHLFKDAHYASGAPDFLQDDMLRNALCVRFEQWEKEHPEKPMWI